MKQYGCLVTRCNHYRVLLVVRLWNERHEVNINIHVLNLSQYNHTHTSSHHTHTPHPLLKTQSNEEEVVDILPQIRKDGLQSCHTPKAAYDACVKRVQAKDGGDCESWYFDLLGCVDKYAAGKVFVHTK